MAVASGYPRECALVSGTHICLVVTVLDERASIDGLLSSVEAQTLQPDEVVVVDGGSTDGTWEALQAWQGRLPLTLLREPGANISRGRNLGIEQTRATWCAVTDAGVRLDPHWLERLAVHVDESVDVVSGFFRADPRSPFETALGATTLPAVEDVKPDQFLPSSRSVLVRRLAWRVVGGYPEWLDYCEDLVFDLALKAQRCRFRFEPTAIAYFRPRASLGQFWRQYYLYARGDGKADLWRVRHAIRYGTYLTALALLRWAPRPLVLALFATGAAAYTRRPYVRLLPLLANRPLDERLAMLAWVPLVRLVGDLAKMAGYPVGVWWRLRHAPARP